MFLTCALLAMSVPFGTGARSAVALKKCRGITVQRAYDGVHRKTVGLWADHGATCADARRVARKWMTAGSDHSRRPLGYTCSGGSDGVSCAKGRRHVTWGYYYD